MAALHFGAFYISPLILFLLALYVAFLFLKKIMIIINLIKNSKLTTLKTKWEIK